jgi:D-alanine-D-alanine ligase
MKRKIGIIFGGPSNEHEVSISSAINVVKNIDKVKFEIVLIYWDKKGTFNVVSSADQQDKGRRIAIEDMKNLFEIAFLVTHGKYGEDGVLQAILESQKIKYTGCHVLSSSICMDKLVFRELIVGAGVSQAKYFGFDYNLNSANEIEEIKKKAVTELSFPLFIKPSNSGSSVGITKIDDASKLDDAIITAKIHDTKILIEEGFVDCREIEVAILGNSDLIISDPGQLIVPGGFYDYDQKYKLGETETRIPADISESEVVECKKIAEKTYRLCGCSGFARIDFFIGDGGVYLSEINTIPGFTDISMYPKLMENIGISYADLISRIIGLAF